MSSRFTKQSRPIRSQAASLYSRTASRFKLNTIPEIATEYENNFIYNSPNISPGSRRLLSKLKNTLDRYEDLSYRTAIILGGEEYKDMLKSKSPKDKELVSTLKDNLNRINKLVTIYENELSRVESETRRRAKSREKSATHGAGSKRRSPSPSDLSKTIRM